MNASDGYGKLIPQHDPYLLYCDHLERDGTGLFEQVCSHDLEGIVAKRRHGAYLPDSVPDWLKIRNRQYSQWIGRAELFERERKSNPDANFGSWISACLRARLWRGMSLTPAMNCSIFNAPM